jgi:fucose 4-O-acetylase-like acetyltransferase
MSPHASSEPRSAGLWFAVVAPPAAWFVSLVVGYFAVHEVCRVHSPLAPRIISLVALIVAIAAGLGGRGIWVASQHERTRFMAQIGVLGSAVFSLIILLQIVATILIAAVARRPANPKR